VCNENEEQERRIHCVTGRWFIRHPCHYTVINIIPTGEILVHQCGSSCPEARERSECDRNREHGIRCCILPTCCMLSTYPTWWRLSSSPPTLWCLQWRCSVSFPLCDARVVTTDTRIGVICHHLYIQFG
jgi:hypothetical protein